MNDPLSIRRLYGRSKGRPLRVGQSALVEELLPALSVPDDVTSAIVRPLVGNQGVRLIGSRNGLTQELWLANVACAG